MVNKTLDHAFFLLNGGSLSIYNKMSKRNAVQYVQSTEPAFIRQFKEKIGYKEGPNVDTKRQKLEDECEETESRSDTEEEKPVVVVLKSDDLTAEEASEMEKMKKQQEEKEAIRDGKIKFKKPIKKGTEKIPVELEKESSEVLSKNKRKNKTSKTDKMAVGSSRLLSFGEEDEDGR